MAHPNQDLVPKMGNSVITDPPQVEGNQVATLAVKPQLDPFQELAFILNKYSQELVDGADPLKISQALNQLQPDDEEAWTQEMWDMYDVLVEQASAANYQVTFNSETN